MAVKATILLAEDDLSLLEVIGDALEDDGYRVERAGSGQEALEKLTAEVALLITDLWMPRMDGLALLEEARQRYSTIQVVLITGNATVASAVQAMKAGAFDYLTKPFTPPELLDVVGRALERRRGVSKSVGAKLAAPTGALENLVGGSPQMKAIHETIRRVAPFKSTVLVQGESGTGKEMVIQAIHELSPRQHGPLVAINCAAVPGNLMESELFGHERGAFTGANTRTQGYFEAAHQGTLFIDEVGELDLAVQAKLLRVLETGRIMPVGSTREKAVDVRVLAATNADLAKSVEEKRFRPDLFYRLNVVRMDLPSLQARREDIPLLVSTLLERLCREHALAVPRVEESFLEALHYYRWPGNIRELRNVLESLLILHQKPVLERGDLPEAIRLAGTEGLDLSSDLQMAEKTAVERALRQCEGDRDKAALLLQISVRTLYRKLARYGIH